MIGDDVLERALHAAAADYPVPDGAVGRVRDRLATPPGDTTGRRRPARRPTRRRWLATGAAASVVLVAVAFALGGSGGSRTSAVGGGSSRSLAPPGAGASGPPAPGGVTGAAGQAASGAVPRGRAAAPMPARVPGAAGAPAKPTGPAQGTTPTALPSAGGPGDSARVVKTGELDLQVSKDQVGSALSRLTALATLEHGYVADTTTIEGGGSPSGDITLRVPVTSFEDAVTRARGLGKVISLQTSGKDVTGQYTDIQARIRALTATRETFLTLLTRATTIGDTLAVQQQITDVQTQIDQLQGQLQLLANQSDLATLTVTVNQAVAPAPAPRHESGLAKAVGTSVGRFVRGAEVIIGLVGPVALVLLLLALGWLGSRFGYRMLRRRLV